MNISDRWRRRSGPAVTVAAGYMVAEVKRLCGIYTSSYTGNKVITNVSYRIMISDYPLVSPEQPLPRAQSRPRGCTRSIVNRFVTTVTTTVTVTVLRLSVWWHHCQAGTRP